MLLLLTHLVCQVRSNMFAYTNVPPSLLLIVVGRSVGRSVGPLGLFLTLPSSNNYFAFYPASLGQLNFRHISRNKIMKKSSNWVLEKSSCPFLGRI